MTLLGDVCGHLSALGVPYALIGAAALAARGIARSTFDIDLLTTDRRVLDQQPWADLVGAGAVVDVRRGDAEDPLAGVVRISAPGQRPVDLVVGRYAWQARAVERAEAAQAGPPVVTMVDLILLKLYAGGAQDLWDVRELLRSAASPALVDAVEVELAALPSAMRTTWNLTKAS